MFNSGSLEAPVVPAKAWLGVSCVCHRLLHFRGACGWNRGAHTAFALSPHETVLLCPDCAWEWVLLVQACPRRPCVARPAEELARHIRSAQTLTQPGAGESASWAKVRKWLLHTVRDRSCSKDEIFLLCRQAFPGVDVGFLSSVFEQVLRVVCREGHLAVTSREGVLILGLS